eukprot:Hpha_TRINITY_DN16758_c0_g2::TRINITY_DN16758_c0_g2_i1::g.79084::m.79084/K07934/IFT27, RAYL, RABL4; intraflagellar transport protein 27
MVVLRCKVAVVGEATVGKSAMVQMFISGGANFPRAYQMTMGIDQSIKEVQVPDRDDAPPGEGREPVAVELYLYDVSGADMYEHICEQYLDGCSFFIAVYDQSNKTTFEQIKKWVERCKKSRKQGPPLPGVLVANKSDLEDRQEVLEIQGEKLAQSLGLDFFQVSALRSINLNTPFEHVARLFARAYEDKLRVRRQQL